MFARIVFSFKTHTLLYLYTLVLLLIIYGLMVQSGTKHLIYISIYAVSFYFAYFLFRSEKFSSKVANLKIAKCTLCLSKSNAYLLAIGLFVLSFIVVFYHFFLLKGVPQIQSFHLKTIDEVALLRRNIILNTPLFFKYLSSIYVKAIFPFLLLYFLHTKRYALYYAAFLLACFYGFALMQKSYILTILVPVAVYSLMQKKYFYFIKYCFVVIAVVFSITLFANANIKFDIKENEKNTFVENIAELCSGIKNRILLVPGKIVGEWFDVIPEQKPYLYGDGYRLLAKIKGTEFVNYSIELYPILRPVYIARGLQGSVNAASFMYDYANFGVLGLILSGILLSLLLVLIELIFTSDFQNKLSLNLFNIMILSSAALSTTILSGGWFFIVLLYVLFKKQLTNG